MSWCQDLVGLFQNCGSNCNRYRGGSSSCEVLLVYIMFRVAVNDAYVILGMHLSPKSAQAWVMDGQTIPCHEHST